MLRDLDLARFREHLRLVNDTSRRYMVNFTRGPLFGTGDGHHSPIAGYLVDEDLVLVLDVNEKYGPWLVKLERLYEARVRISNAGSRLSVAGRNARNSATQRDRARRWCCVPLESNNHLLLESEPACVADQPEAADGQGWRRLVRCASASHTAGCR